MTVPLLIPDDRRRFTPLDPCDWRLIHEALCMYVGVLEARGTLTGAEDEADRTRHARWVRGQNDGALRAVTAPLPLPDDARIGWMFAAWDAGTYAGSQWPRSRWLHDFEQVLRAHYPTASSRRLSLTARGAAPFPLRDGPNVP